MKRQHFAPIAMETGGFMGALGRAQLRHLSMNYAEPVEWLPPQEGDAKPKFKDHGGKYSIFCRHLYEAISVALQLGNARILATWAEQCVPLVAAAPAADQAAVAAGAGG